MTADMLTPFVHRDGHYWPRTDLYAWPVLTRGVKEDVPAVLSFIPGRRCIVQAGANVGLYPIALAKHFARVITLEPDHENFACLALNLADHGADNVEFRLAAFGEWDGRCETFVAEAGNCGAHQVRPGNDVPVVTIDGLLLPACDAIWLDVEGCELAALRGAEITLREHSPTVIFEDKGHGPSPAGWLETQGYGEAARVANDRIFIKGE